MNKKFLINLIFIIIIIIIPIIINKYKNIEQKQNEISEDSVINTETSKTVENLKSETGATASEEMYEIQEEYDGRQVLAIKPDVQFRTVLTGILKTGKPSEQEINELDLSKFHKGIWISEVSRNKFLQILTDCGINNFGIDEEGYLYKKENSQNEYSLKLEKLMNLEELTIIDITGTCYMRDEMTGDVVEYPFKDMDLYQICEIFETEGSKIIIITTNDVDEMEVLNAICE